MAAVMADDLPEREVFVAESGSLNPTLTLRPAKVTVGANSDNGEQPALRNSERGDRRV
jgi:hypothetical protein